MSTDTTGTAVRHSITVEAPLDKAFSVFADDMASWWPPEHHLGPVAEMVFEALGGHIYDTRLTGTRSFGPVPGLRTTDPAGVLLGRQPTLATRGQPQSHGRGRSPLYRGRPKHDARRRVGSPLERHGEGSEQLRRLNGDP